MKIKTQVSISIIVFAILAVVILFSFFSSNNQLHEIQKKQQIIDSIEKSSFELYYLENDYILHGGTRTVERWNAKYAVLTGQLLELTVTDPSQQAVLSGIFDSHRNLNISFSNLVAVTGGVQGKEPIGTSQELMEFSASTLAGQTQALMADSSELSQLVKAEAHDVEQRTTLVFLFSIAGLMVFVLLNYLVINRSVLRSISALQKGAQQIGTGDLDTKIETGTSDELGDLSSAITAMASSLKTVLASKSELEKEVADRKRAEAQLKESETRYREFFTTSRDGVFITSPDGRIIDFNNAMLEMFGYDNREEMSNLSVPSLYAHSEDRSVFLNLIVRDGYVKEFPVQLKRRDGTVIDSLITGVPLRNPDGTIKALIGTARDITERKREDAALKASEHKFRTLVENIPEKIFVKDALLAYVSCNAPYARDLGIAAEAIAGKTDFDFYPRDLAEKYRADDRAVMASGVSSMIDERYVLNGVEFWVSTLKTPVRDNAGNISGILGIFHDITEQKRVEGAIRQSEERYRTLAEASPDQIFIVGRDDTIQYVNSTALKLLRLPYDQVIGKPRTDLFPPEIAKSQSASLQMVFETGESIRKEEMIPFGMKELWVDLSLVPLKDEVGNVTSILGIARDITERKRVNEVLRESEVRFRTMADWTSDWEYWIDLNRKFIYLSPSVERITGYRPEEFMADPYLIDRIVHPDDRMMWDAHVPLHLTTKEINQSEIEFRLIHKDGSVRWISHICRSIFLDDGTCIGKRVSNRDVTDRKRVEAALQESEILLNEVSEMARVGGWDLDIATKDIRLTRETYHIFESPEGSLVSMSNAILFFDMPDRSRLEAALQQCMEHGEPYDLELPFTSATGRHIWTRAMGRAVKSDGRIVKLTGTFQDITEHKQTEELRRHFAEELEQQVKSRTKDLNASLDEKVILLREVHHRVNNNLQIIISLLNLQSRQITDPGVIAALKESIQRVRTISMVHEKLYQSESLSQIDLADYIRFLSTQIVSYYGIDTRTVTLGIDIEKVMIDVNTAIPLGLILNELISNALRHGFPGGRGGTVSISGRYGDKALTITVKDDGVGLPPGLDWRNTESLGLRLVNSLVDQLDGTIEYRNEHGTMFTITVPTKNAK